MIWFFKENSKFKIYLIRAGKIFFKISVILYFHSVFIFILLTRRVKVFEIFKIDFNFVTGSQSDNKQERQFQLYTDKQNNNQIF